MSAIGERTLPQEWGVKPLGSLLKRSPSYGLNAPAIPFDGKHPIYLRITDVSEQGHFAPDPLVSVDHPKASDYQLTEGDLVFARTGASVGKSYLYRTSDGPLVFAGFLVRVSPNPSCLIPAFLGQFVRTKQFWDWVGTQSTRSGQPGVNANQYRRLEVPVPPVAEQRAIVEALGDVDALNASLDRLIAKERDIKQATMQQLLTGETRLPGYDAAWGSRTLGQLGTFYKGAGIKATDLIDEGVACIRYGEIYTRYHDRVTEPVSRVPREVTSSSVRLRPGDLLFAGSGETAEEIGKCVAFFGVVETVAGGDVVVLRPEAQDSDFLAALINNHPAVAAQRASLAQGDAVVHIYPSHLSQLEFRLPNPEEQRAIAQILRDMDGELALLRKRREKTQAIKQGMMQALLTGRIRLVEPEVAA